MTATLITMAASGATIATMAIYSVRNALRPAPARTAAEMDELAARGMA